MAEAFLNQLLRVENSVQAQPNSSSEPCIICFRDCGTLCPESGIVEWEIRLPCKHIVGSRCIAKWLDPTGSAKNSCPVCRYVFFPIGDNEGIPLHTPRDFRRYIPDDEGISLDTPEDFREYRWIDTWDLRLLGGGFIHWNDRHQGNGGAENGNEEGNNDEGAMDIGNLRRGLGGAFVTRNDRRRGNDGADNGNEAANEEGNNNEGSMYIGDLRRSVRLRGIAQERNLGGKRERETAKNVPEF